MTDELVLAYDVGTTNIKAVLAGPGVEVVGEASGGYPLRRLGRGWVEQDLDDVASVMAILTRRLLNDARVRSQQVAAVSVTGQMFNAVPVGADSAPQHPMISWLDQRAADEARTLERRIPARQQYQLFDAVLSAKDIVPKISWLARHHPRAEAETATYLDCKEAVVHALTGRAVTDPVGASSYRLYDIEAGRWDLDRCRAAEVPVGRLPEVRSAFSAAGELLPEPAADLGLLPGTPVAVGSGDVAASQLGAGAVGPGDVHLSIGTSSYFGITLDRPLPDPAKRLGPLAHLAPDRWLLWLEIATAGGALAWLDRVLSGAPHAVSPPSRLAGLDGASDATDMDGLLYAPWLSGERVPVFDDAIRGAFVGLGLHHDSQHLARAVMEGVAYQMRWALEYGVGFGLALGTIRVVGGGAAGAGFLQLVADVLGRPLHLVDSPEHAATRAAALMATGMLDGRADLTTAHARISRVVEPRVPEQARHDDNFDRFRALYAALAALDHQQQPWAAQGSVI